MLDDTWLVYWKPIVPCCGQFDVGSLKVSWWEIQMVVGCVMMGVYGLGAGVD